MIAVPSWELKLAFSAPLAHRLLIWLFILLAHLFISGVLFILSVEATSWQRDTWFFSKATKNLITHLKNFTLLEHRENSHYNLMVPQFRVFKQGGAKARFDSLKKKILSVFRRSVVNLGSDSLIKSFVYQWPQVCCHQIVDSSFVQLLMVVLTYCLAMLKKAPGLWMPWLSLFGSIHRLFLSHGSLWVLGSRLVLLFSN